MENRSGPVTVWVLELHLSRMVSDAALSGLREILGWHEKESGAPLVWEVRGANCTVKTERGPGVLIRIASWAMDSVGLRPTGFSVESMRTEPLNRKGQTS